MSTYVFLAHIISPVFYTIFFYMFLKALEHFKNKCLFENQEALNRAFWCYFCGVLSCRLYMVILRRR